MGANSRMTIAIHVLCYLVVARSKRPDPVTSDQIALSVATNPVVIRRMLGLLRKAGLVVSQRGANAGWHLAKDPDAITLLEVYRAVEEGSLFRLHASPPNPNCPVVRALKPALNRLYGGLEKQLERELAKSTIAEVLTQSWGQ
jgi:Rrf2 family protein